MFYHSFIQEAIRVFQPLLLGKIIQYFENYDPDDQESLSMVYVYAAAMSLSSFGLNILQHLYYYYIKRTGMRIRVAMCHMIYRKVGGDSADSHKNTHFGLSRLILTRWVMFSPSSGSCSQQ